MDHTERSGALLPLIQYLLDLFWLMPLGVSCLQRTQFSVSTDSRWKPQSRNVARDWFPTGFLTITTNPWSMCPLLPALANIRTIHACTIDFHWFCVFSCPAGKKHTLSFCSCCSLLFLIHHFGREPQSTCLERNSLFSGWCWIWVDDVG